MSAALARTEALRPGDDCQWRYPARLAWKQGRVVVNGGSSYWTVLNEDGMCVGGLYIEQISAPGERWYDPA